MASWEMGTSSWAVVVVMEALVAAEAAGRRLPRRRTRLSAGKQVDAAQRTRDFGRCQIRVSSFVNGWTVVAGQPSAAFLAS